MVVTGDGPLWVTGCLTRWAKMKSIKDRVENAQLGGNRRAQPAGLPLCWLIYFVLSPLFHIKYSKVADVCIILYWDMKLPHLWCSHQACAGTAQDIKNHGSCHGDF